ncbi:MAG: hypothetical protein AAF846_12195 [Chloroflexota bacterium]
MKSEYNYGIQYRYRLTLTGENLGNDLKRLREIYKAFYKYVTVGKIPAYAIRDAKRGGKIVWDGLDKPTFEELVNTLNSIESTLDICEYHIYYALQPDVLTALFNLRYPDIPEEKNLEFSRFHNQWYSADLSSMNEYALNLWAEQEKIDIAYRLSMFKAFSPNVVMRIWLVDNIAYFSYKIEDFEADCYPTIKSHDVIELPMASLQKIEEFMDRNFWTSQKWYSVPDGIMIQDGVIYLFEGWHDGKYKLLDDHSPDSNQRLSYQAVELFQSLINDTES